jgi:hypothetical protein
MVGRCAAADRLGIHRIVLLPLHERLDIGGWDQPHVMAQRRQFTAPMMRAAAGFHSHGARRLRGEEVEHLRPAQPLRENASTA